MAEAYVNSAAMVGKEIEMARKEKGMTQKRLAKEMNVNQRILADWERGKIMPNEGQCFRLSNLLSIPVDNLKGRKESLEKVQEDLKASATPVITIPSSSKLIHVDPPVSAIKSEPKLISFPDGLKKKRLEQKLTQKDVGEMIGISSPMYSRIETGLLLPSKEQKEKLEEVFDCKFDTKVKEPFIQANKSSIANLGWVEVTDAFRENLRHEMAINRLTEKNLFDALGFPVQGILSGEVKHIRKNWADKLGNYFKKKTQEVKPAEKIQNPVIKKKLNEDFKLSRVDRNFIENVKHHLSSKSEEESMCKKVGLAPGYFYREEYEMAPFTLETAVKISDVLGISLCDLTKDSEKVKLQEEILRAEKHLMELKNKMEGLNNGR